MTNEPVGHKRVWDKERERERKAAQRAAKKSGTPVQSSPDTIEEEIVVAQVVEEILDEDEDEARIEGLRSEEAKELADLEERVRIARLMAMPPAHGADGVPIETWKDVQDRAEAYARWRYQSWKDGKTVSPY